MKGFSDKQNEVFGKLFGELKKHNPTYKSDALAMLKLDDENFERLYTDTDNLIIVDEEDINLCHDRARHLKLNPKN